MHHATFVADLAVVLGVAGVTGVLARLLKQPTILGYLFAGLIVGPYIAVPVFADPGRVEALAEFGVVLVMFAIGLEFRIAKLVRVLPVAGLTGLIQVSFLMWCGFSVGQLLGWTTVGAVFLGASIAISSTMVVSKVFEQQPVSRRVRDYVLAVLVIQDVLAIVLIAAMTGVAVGKGLAPAQLAATLSGLAAVLLGLLVGGLLVVPRVVRAVVRLNSPEILAVVAIGLCFAIAELANALGYSVALGSFIAGILVAESGRGHKVEHLIQPVRDMFAAIFFVSVGMAVDPRQAMDNLPVSLMVFAVVVSAQFVSVSIAGVLSGNGLRRSVTAGLSLGQIGEFAFIIGAIGIGAGVAPPELQSILVTTAVLTAFTTPMLLRSAGRVVDTLDRWMPERLQHLLSLYEEWLDSSRTSAQDVPKSPLRRAIRALAFDTGALIALAAFALTWRPEAAAWLREQFSVSEAEAPVFVRGAVVLVSVPLFVALVRNILSVSRLVRARILPPVDQPTPTGRAAAKTLAGMVYLVLVLAVGAPAVAILRPFTGEPYGAALLSLIVIWIAVRLWRSTNALEHEFRSGAEQIADALKRQVADEEPTTLQDPALLPGLDSVSRIVLREGGHAVGKTLTQLNLRAETGATVLAIHRDNADVLLPTGHEQLRAGDVLAINGTAGAIAKAKEVLLAAPVRQSAPLT